MQNFSIYYPYNITEHQAHTNPTEWIFESGRLFPLYPSFRTHQSILDNLYISFTGTKKKTPGSWHTGNHALSLISKAFLTIRWQYCILVGRSWDRKWGPRGCATLKFILKDVYHKSRSKICNKNALPQTTPLLAMATYIEADK